MIVCEYCGYKRCPHASNKDYQCTGSNEVGQIGSSYLAVSHQLLLEALTLLEKSRDHLTLRHEYRINSGEINRFIEKVKKCTQS